ncbi:MAG: Rrf2 family transcriptional regulator [Christensenellaceae bacterium]|nr:Rrf2 family transcriptional regulator [Christensenellaceae bacterium]MBR3843106.1 Rrf2 family transcriptional regulator [Christensenellaceae bacterium]
MKLSTKGRYGLRAIIDLAMNGQDGPVPISSIASRQSLSESYLEQLMAKLKKAGLVTSIRGAQGGYFLAKSSDEISVGDILRALEGDINPVDCVALTQDGKLKCKNSSLCVSKYVWKRINDSITETVDAIKLSTLLEETLQ